MERIIEHGGDFVYDYCRSLPPAIVELETRDAGCEQPGRKCQYDAEGRVLERVVGPNDRGWMKLQRHTYDARGRLATTEVEHNGQCTVHIAYERDGQGRIVREHRRQRCQKDASHWIRYEYDQFGRVDAIEEKLRLPSHGSTTTTLQYDASGRLLGSKSETGLEVTLLYDERGYCAGMMEGKRLIYRYERDRDGTLLASEDEFVRATLERGPNGRIVRKVLQDKVGSDPPEVLEYEYDAGGHCTGVSSSSGSHCEYVPVYWGACPWASLPSAHTECDEPW